MLGWSATSRTPAATSTTTAGVNTHTRAPGRGSGTPSGRTPTRTTARSTRCWSPRPTCGRSGLLVGPGGTALAQAVVVALSGSVALLGDALHNSADALTAVPLGIAFLLRRRRPPRRYAYGYGLAATWPASSSSRLSCSPRPRPRSPPSAGCCTRSPVTHLASRSRSRPPCFAGNEWSPGTGSVPGADRLGGAGRRRLHARTDGFTSLAVLAGAGGVASAGLGRPGGGPAITVVILAVGWQAAREVGRLLDSVDPALTEQAEATLRATPGVLAAGPVRLAGSAVRCGPSARSRSTRAARSSRRTTSRSAPSTR